MIIKIRKLLLFLILLILPSVLFAQSEMLKGSSLEERSELQTDMMVEELALQDSISIEKVRAINLKYAEKVESLAASNKSRRQKFKKMRNIGEQKDDELRSVLTEEQYKVYLEKKEEMRERMKEHYKSNWESVDPDSSVKKKSVNNLAVLLRSLDGVDLFLF